LLFVAISDIEVMTMSRASTALLTGLMAAAAPSVANAEESPDGVGGWGTPRRETALALGYGAIWAMKPPVSYQNARSRDYLGVLTGLSLEVTTRPLAIFEYGLGAWSTGGSPDNGGTYLHEMSRFTAQGRFFPWGFGRVEPWIGAELGILVADDRAIWDDPQTGRHSVASSRVGYVEGLIAGGRARLGDLVAAGLCGGLLFVGFTRADPVVHEPGDAKGTYFIRPTDYGRRLWYSLMLSIELTVRD
jgi:hypothetical protein